jgi:O-antigen/teichoic acid export membrane protein
VPKSPFDEGGVDNWPVDRQRVAAVVAQFTQAAASLALTMIAVRELDTADFGRFLLVTATILITTSATTGLVGDSLTVLDRSDPGMRRALQVTALASAATAGLVVGLLSALLGWLEGPLAVLAGVAATAFVLEDLARRVLMANRRFPSVVVTDLAYVVAAAATLAAAHLWWTLGLAALFAAILVGQLVALIVAVALIPDSDRYLVALRGPREVGRLMGFGGWRALHLTVAPLRMWIARLIVSGVSGFAAVGLVEANRLVMAPLMLAIQGASSAVLVSHVALMRQSPGRARRQADREAATFAAATGAAVLVLLALQVPLANLLVGSTDLLRPPLLLGWGLVAIGMALNVPYANLTAATGAARAALAVRLLDLLLVLAATALLVGLLPAGTWFLWLPAAMGAVSCALTVVQRSVAFRSTRMGEHDAPAL